MIWLPFLGQQIWDFSVHGKSIKMHSPVQTPSRGLSYLENYGALLLHCGISGMGNPSIEDTQPLHGELPAAAFQSAWLADDHGRLVLGGTYSYRNAYGVCYDFSPAISLDAGETRFAVNCTLTNTRKRTIPYQYLVHINFPPEFNDRIYSTAVLSPENVTIRKNPPETEGFLKEAAKGNIKYLDQGESVDFIYSTGVMTGSELQALIRDLKFQNPAMYPIAELSRKA